MRRIFISLVILGTLFSQVTFAQQSREQLSQEAANPLADLMSFPFQNNLNMNYGPYDRNMNILNIQPVLPFAEGQLITRTIFPIVRIPDFSSESGKYSSGLSDVVFTAFYTPKSKTMLGIGPVLEIPTGGEKRGSQKWSAASGQKWIVPLGAGGGKLLKLDGKLPLNIQTQVYYNVVHPDFGPEWQWCFQAQIPLNKSILKAT